ncbi:Crp/Fnr family transcriptional regulator [soil metagenome]|jgi:CRP/FNR family transcriptional regulator
MGLEPGKAGSAREEDVRLLSLVDIFEPLSREELKEINWKHLSTPVQPGEVFYTPMDLAETLFVLLKGRVRIYKKSPEGRELTLSVVESGTVFGEMTLTAQRLRNAYAEGMEPSEVAALCRADVERLVLQKPHVGLQLVHLLSDRLTAYEERMEGLGLKEVPARLASLILQLVEEQGVVTGEGYRIPVRYTHQQLGTMIGANREAVTRAFSRLREAGAVQTRRRYVHVEDLETLKEATEDGFSDDA